MLDRIDIHVEVPRVESQKLSDDRLGEPSAAIRSQAEVARERQRQRFANGQIAERRMSKFDAGYIVCNTEMRIAEIGQFCKSDGAGVGPMRAAMG